MRIIKTNMGKEITMKWREELREMAPSQYHYDIDKGVCDYLFSCTYVELHDIERAIKETHERN